MATTTTLLALRQAIARKLWATLLPNVIDTTGTAVDTTTVVVRDAAYSSAQANAYDGVYIYIAELVTGGPAIGEVARVTRAGFAPTTGTFTVSPAYTDEVQTGTDVIFHYGLPPDEMLQAINRIQNRLYVPAYLPLSLITDGDMEGSGVTNWAAVGTPTTRAKITTAARVLFGIRALNLVTDAVDEGATSDSVAVTEGRTAVVAVAVQLDSGSAAVILRNVTAGSDIKSVTVDETQYTLVFFTESVPDNCQQVAIRILSKTAVSDIVVGFASLLINDQAIYNLPSQVADAMDLGRPKVTMMPLGSSSEASDSYTALTERFQPWPSSFDLRDWRGANSQRIQVGTPITRPLFLNFRRSLPDLSADADTTEAPEELVVEGVLADLKQRMADASQSEATKRWMTIEAARHRSNFAREAERLGLLRPQVEMVTTRRVSI